LTRDTFAGCTLQIHRVRCRPHDGACGPVEESTKDGLALPLRGLFVKHGRRDERLVADPCHALFFKAGEPYRVSHPVEGGDDCLFLEPGAELAEEMATWPPVKVLEARTVLERGVLAHRLERRLASPLEAEERALGLLGALRHAGSRALSSRERSRRTEIVAKAQIALAREPGRAWRLGELAHAAHCSPFYLTRTFHHVVGMPLHRYQLRARLAAAMSQVLDSARDFTAIALDVGFSSHSHFTAAFRRAYGVTPSALRNKAGSARS